MKILLINLKTPKKETQKATYVPPIGLWKIRATLNEIPGIETHICDEHIGDKTENYINKNLYRYIGISCRFSIQHEELKRVIQLVKLTCADIIIGGNHAVYNDIVKNVHICRIPGEQYFLKVIRGISYLDINKYTYPTFSISEIYKYWRLNAPHDLKSKTKRWISIVTSQGCNGVCGYCSSREYWGKWRPYSIIYIKNYLQYLRTKGMEELFIEDDNISHDKERFIELMKEFKKNKMVWSCPNGIRIRSLFDKEILKALEKSTCWRLSLPFETGNKKTAKLMRLGNKFLSIDQSKEIVNKLKAIGIKTCGFFIIGYPGEDLNDIKRTLDYANSLDLDQRNIYIATPYPGSELYQICKENGFLVYDGEELFKNMLYTKGLIKTPDFSPDLIEKIKYDDRQAAISRKSS